MPSLAVSAPPADRTAASSSSTAIPGSLRLRRRLGQLDGQGRRWRITIIRLLHIGDTSPVPSEIATLQGIALAGIFQIIISQAGRRTREGESQDSIADEPYPLIERTVDELDRWFSTSWSAA
jgi:hypothetical protein